MWLALRDLLPVMQCPRAQLVLEAIFADEDVLDALAAGQAMLPTGKQLPLGVLRLLKRNLVGHMQSNYYHYRHSIEYEMVRIRRLKDTQMRAVTFFGAAITAGLVGVAKYASRAVYEHYNDDA